MPIIGCKFWNDRDCFHVQDNNVIEEILRKKRAQGYLESCGPTSAINAICVMYGPTFFDDKVKVGTFTFQPEDVLTAFFNDFRNYSEFQKIRKDFNPSWTPCNEIPQLYPYAIKQLFNLKCEFMWLKDWNKIVEYLKNGQAVILCEPGHYTTAVAYDDEKDEIIYNDPWNGHYVTGGFNLRYTKDFYTKKIRNFVNVFF